MSEKLRLDRKIGFQITICTKSIYVTIDSIGPSIILRSIFINKIGNTIGELLSILGSDMIL